MGARAVPAGGFAACSRAVWVSVSRHYDRDGRCSLDWDGRRRVTPVQTTSPEAWPEAEPLGWNNSLRREPWWNAVKRARSKRARAASQDAAVATQRLPAFRFLLLFVS